MGREPIVWRFLPCVEARVKRLSFRLYPLPKEIFRFPFKVSLAAILLSDFRPSLCDVAIMDTATPWVHLKAIEISTKVITLFVW